MPCTTVMYGRLTIAFDGSVSALGALSVPVSISPRFLRPFPLQGHWFPLHGSRPAPHGSGASLARGTFRRARSGFPTTRSGGRRAESGSPMAAIHGLGAMVHGRCAPPHAHAPPDPVRAAGRCGRSARPSDRGTQGHRLLPEGRMPESSSHFSIHNSSFSNS
jgi:hypothetical protein